MHERQGDGLSRLHQITLVSGHLDPAAQSGAFSLRSDSHGFAEKAPGAASGRAARGEDRARIRTPTLARIDCVAYHNRCPRLMLAITMCIGPGRTIPLPARPRPSTGDSASVRAGARAGAAVRCASMAASATTSWNANAGPAWAGLTTRKVSSRLPDRVRIPLPQPLAGWITHGVRSPGHSARRWCPKIYTAEPHLPSGHSYYCFSTMKTVPPATAPSSPFPQTWCL